MSINQLQKRIETEPGWKHLPLDRIQKALQLQPQAESWSCGPNSGYRALILKGDKSSDKELRSFINQCPKSLGTPQTKPGKILNVLTGGIASGIGLLKGDVGPTPSSLANYINKHSNSKVQRFIGKTWDNFWTQLCLDIHHADPAIILVQYGIIDLHYINLIGYNPHNESVAILDTNNAIEFCSTSQFHDRAKITVPYIRGTWNAVRFYA